MAKESRQKLKLLYLYKILSKKTDENHTITVADMISELSKFGISAERKAIYDDLEQLKLFGLDIESRKSKTHDYFIASRDFSYNELKLLAGSIQSSLYIPQKKGIGLIRKLSALTSTFQAKKLQKQIFVPNNNFDADEVLFYNIDTIQDAISKNKQICFKYYEWVVSNKAIVQKDSICHIETPVALTCDAAHYYLITYKDSYNLFAYYRADRISNLEIMDRCRSLPKGSTDIPSYVRQKFSVFGGDETEVCVRFSNHYIGIVYDYFGTNTVISEIDDTHFTAKLNVSVNPDFLSWVISFGSGALILSPGWVADKIRLLAAEAINQYPEDTADA